MRIELDHALLQHGDGVEEASKLVVGKGAHHLALEGVHGRNEPTQGGRFPGAGSFHGPDAMFGHFMEFMTMVEGQFSMDLHDVMASEERVAVYLTVTIGHHGEQLGFDEVHLWRIEDGLLVEMRAIPFDPYTFDDFLAGAAATSS